MCLLQFNETNASSVSQLQDSSRVGMPELLPGQLTKEKIKKIQANNLRNKKYGFAFIGIFGGNNLVAYGM